MNSLLSTKIRVLIVEDSEEDAILIVRELKSDGLQVSFLRVDTEQAMREALNDNWDVVLSDYNMPKFSALAALEVLKKSKKDLPFIVVSGTIDDDIAVQLMQAGAHDYVMKDNLNRLASAIDREIGDAKIRRQKKEGILALEHAVEEWDVTFNAMSDAVFILSTQYGIVKCNNAAESLIGKKREDIIGKYCYKIMHGTTAPHEECPHHKMLNSKHQKTAIINYNNKIMEVNVDPIFNNNHELTGSVHTMHDITERIENEEKLRVALINAESGSKAKSEFLATMSHEIRTPLNGLIGFSSIIENMLCQSDDYEQRDKIIEYLAIVKTCGQTVTELINDILELASINAGDTKKIIEEFSPEELIIESDKIFKLKAEENNTSLDFQHKNLPVKVSGARRQLKQVIFNLVGNAIKFTEKGSVNIKADYKDGNLLIEVEDTGIGIVPDMKDKILKPFTQLDQSSTRRFGGVGLGLTIVSKILGNFNESLNVESELDKGTKVSFVFPVKVVKSFAPAKKLSEKLASQKTTSNILVIEDDEISILYLQEVLKDICENYKVAKSFVQMQEICNEDFIPDIALIDISLPEENGFECMKWLRNKFPQKNIKCIAQTAHVLYDDAKRYYDAGFNAFIGKPYKQEELIKLLKNPQPSHKNLKT